MLGLCITADDLVVFSCICYKIENKCSNLELVNFQCKGKKAFKCCSLMLLKPYKVDMDYNKKFNK